MPPLDRPRPVGETPCPGRYLATGSLVPPLLAALGPLPVTATADGRRRLRARLSLDLRRQIDCAHPREWRLRWIR
jgi:hypothetical protein